MRTTTLSYTDVVMTGPTLKRLGYANVDRELSFFKSCCGFTKKFRELLLKTCDSHKVYIKNITKLNIVEAFEHIFYHGRGCFTCRRKLKSLLERERLFSKMKHRHR